MKRLVLAVLCAVLLIGSACAEVDLSGMSFSDLLALKERINLALFQCDEWQEVKVPAGMYKIGTDIPAGKWVISPIDGETARVYWGEGTTSGGTEIDDEYAYEQITSPNDSYAKYNKVESVMWELANGTYLLIQDSPVIFTPFTGISLGFK